MHEQTVAPKRDLPDFPVTLVRTADGMTTVVKEAGGFVQLMQTGRFEIQGEQEAPAEAPKPKAKSKPKSKPKAKKKTSK